MYICNTAILIIPHINYVKSLLDVLEDERDVRLILSP